MTFEDVVLLSVSAAVLVLPWTLKTAGLYEKMKLWYKVLLSGFLIGIIPMATMVFVDSWKILWFISGSVFFQMMVLWVEIIGILMMIIGLLGITKKLLFD